MWWWSRQSFNDAKPWRWKKVTRVKASKKCSSWNWTWQVKLTLGVWSPKLKEDIRVLFSARTRNHIKFVVQQPQETNRLFFFFKFPNKFSPKTYFYCTWRLTAHDSSASHQGRHHESSGWTDTNNSFITNVGLCEFFFCYKIKISVSKINCGGEVIQCLGYIGLNTWQCFFLWWKYLPQFDFKQ